MISHYVVMETPNIVVRGRGKPLCPVYFDVAMRYPESSRTFSMVSIAVKSPQNRFVSRATGDRVSRGLNSIHFKIMRNQHPRNMFHFDVDFGGEIDMVRWFQLGVNFNHPRSVENRGRASFSFSFLFQKINRS